MHRNHLPRETVCPRALRCRDPVKMDTGGVVSCCEYRPRFGIQSCLVPRSLQERLLRPSGSRARTKRRRAHSRDTRQKTDAQRARDSECRQELLRQSLRPPPPDSSHAGLECARNGIAPTRGESARDSQRTQRPVWLLRGGLPSFPRFRLPRSGAVWGGSASRRTDAPARMSRKLLCGLASSGFFVLIGHSAQSSSGVQAST